MSLPSRDEGGLEGHASSLREGTNLFEGYGDEAKNKYGYLAPFDLTPLGLWEKSYLDEDGGTTRIESILKAAGVGLILTENPFNAAPKEAWEKYAHLMPVYHRARTIEDPAYDPVIIRSQQD